MLWSRILVLCIAAGSQSSFVKTPFSPSVANFRVSFPTGVCSEVVSAVELIVTKQAVADKATLETFPLVLDISYENPVKRSASRASMPMEFSITLEFRETENILGWTKVVFYPSAILLDYFYANETKTSQSK